MLRQLQLRAPIQAIQLSRCFSHNAKQFELPLLEMVSKPMRPFIKIGPSIQKSPINIRPYSVCLNPVEALQSKQEVGAQLNRCSANLTGGNGVVYSDIAVVKQSNSVALVPLEHASTVQKSKPQSSALINMPEQPMRKVPYFNPLRRRSMVDPRRVEYIKERFKMLTMGADNKKQQEKKFISRTTLHSGRLDKID